MRIDSTNSSHYQTLYQQTKTTNENATKLILRGDSLNLSQAGLAISLGKLNVPGAPVAAGVSESNAALNDPTVRALKKAFEEMTRGLSEMKALTEAALDPELTDLDRMELQIEMTKLQSKLFKTAHRLGLDLYPGASSSTDIENALSLIGYEEDVMIAFLEQAKEKVAGGEYARNGSGIDISSLSIYTPPPEDALFSTEFSVGEGETQPVKERGTEPVPGGSLVRLLFRDFRNSSAPRLDQAEADVANPAASWSMTTGILLTDLKSAIISAERIEKKSQELEELKMEFEKLVKEMPPEGYAGKGIEEGDPGWHGMPTSLNKSALTITGQMSLGGMPSGLSSLIDAGASRTSKNDGELRTDDAMMSHDYRMENPRNPLEAFAEKVNTFFKDELYKELGYSMRTGV